MKNIKKTAGIIGGIAPESTIAYYRLIISGFRQIVKDGSYPSILINSIDMKKMLDLIGADRLGDVTQYLLDEIKKLAKAGADFGILASNTPHIVFDDLQRQSPIPLISIVDVTYEACHHLGLKKVGLFGTRFTMQGPFYPQVFNKRGISIIVPAIENQDYIHNKYMGELVNGVFLPETRQMLLSIVEQLQTREDIQGLILGGTELPLILTEDTYGGIPFFDTTKLHVAQIIEEMLK
ncbi:MAG: amino acid racemase [Anaerolineales bacterium]|nr:amino acid racemase [Anaerolineales bacterium]